MAIEANKRYNQGNGELIFVRGNDYMTPRCLSAQIERGCEHIGIPVKRMHKIRKTYASVLYNYCKNISIVKDMLGHCSEETTWNHYIYNPEDSKTTDDLVVEALDNTRKMRNLEDDVITCDNNIIEFPRNKKAGIH